MATNTGLRVMFQHIL